MGELVRAEPGPVADGALVPPPEVAAAIAAAAEALVAEMATAPAQGYAARRGGPEYVWRFSGRWWSLPVPMRRDRPWKER
jgi:hypothetical protein